MADSRAKRSSSAQMVVPFILSPVLPDGTIGQGDRQQTVHTYSGISAGTLVPPVASNTFEWIIRARRRGRR